MRLDVVLTEDAERDVEEIFRYIEKIDSRKSADLVLERILEVADKLTTAPERASQPPEYAPSACKKFGRCFSNPVASSTEFTTHA